MQNTCFYNCKKCIYQEVQTLSRDEGGRGNDTQVPSFIKDGKLPNSPEVTERGYGLLRCDKKDKM